MTIARGVLGIVIVALAVIVSIPISAGLRSLRVPVNP